MRMLIAAALAVSLAGCLDDPAPPPTERQPTVLDDQLKAIDRAKAVEQEVIDAAEKQNADIEAQGG